MAYETVYSYRWFTFAPIIFFLSIFVIVGIWLLLTLRNPYMRNKILILFMSLVMLIIAGGLFTSSLLNSIVLIDLVYNQYHEGEYLTVEGAVEEFNPSIFDYSINFGTDTFVVQGISFSVGSDVLAGYRKIAAYGGVIHKEGQIVRIHYITVDTRNYIVQIDIPSDE
ncbi:MAG: hypothetical protein Q8M70_06020 [bacterium]|nr:hypothetical protein [bacterium]